MKQRKVQELRTAQPSRDGDGVAIARISGMRHAGMDPILTLDELKSEHREDFAGGFPPHPHRGMQTLTYMKHGGLIHEDNRGNRGEIRSGGAQWMSAGRGIIHSEMPTQDSSGLHGFQLWVNLAAADKLSAPDYRDVPASELTGLTREGVEATAIAGHWSLTISDNAQARYSSGAHTDREAREAALEINGPLTKLATRAAILDVNLAPNATTTLTTAATENVLVYVYAGSISIEGVEVDTSQMAITQSGNALTLVAGETGASMLVLKGEPLREPVANYGPFVMNTQAEIEQAITDYQAGQFG